MTHRPIQLEELTEPELEPISEGSSALDPAQARGLVLRYRIDADPESLEALKHARRSILREEATIGLEPDEPSLDEAVFSSTDVAWLIRPEQRTRCVQKLAELVARANRDGESSSVELAVKRRTRGIREE